METMKSRRANADARRLVPTRRSHGAVIGPPARREIERAGWRTRLEFRESRRRSIDGQLLAIEECWIAEAQRFDGEIASAQAIADTAAGAWDALRAQIERDDVTYHRRVTFAS